MFQLDNPLILSLDVDSAEHCLNLAEQLQGKVGAFKIGPRLIVRFGGALIQQLAKYGAVFVDNKYLDIPSTMDAAIRASFDAGATLATVHAWAGPEALQLLAQTEAELNRQRPFKILAVTVLTSFSPQTLPPPLTGGSIDKLVTDLATSALQSGISGLVCSPHEVQALRSLDAGAFLVTPGVRLPENANDDQVRVMTPNDAIRLGSSALVVGRPIYAAFDPVAAAEKFFVAIKEKSS